MSQVNKLNTRFISCILLIGALLFITCTPQKEKHSDGTKGENNSPDKTSEEAPVKTRLDSNALETATPGRHGIPLPEKEAAIDTNTQPYKGPKHISAGKPDAEKSKTRQANQRVKYAKSPQILDCHDTTTIKLPSEKKPDSCSAQRSPKYQINPGTDDTLCPPKVYKIPEQSSRYTNRTSRAAASVQHGDTLYPPRQIAPKWPHPVDAKPPRFKDMATHNIKYLDVEQGMSSTSILSVTSDSKGNLWFGTSNGVTKYDGETFMHFSTEQGLSHNYIRAVFEDSRGNMWFTTWGGGIIRYDGDKFTIFTTEQGLSNNFVNSVVEDSAGNLWFGTHGGVNKYNGKSFTHYTTRQGVSNDYILDITIDQQGNFWFGTYYNGVTKFNGEQFTQITPKEGLPNQSVYAVHQDSRGNMWFGTEGNGLVKYDGSSFKNYTTAQGLCHNRITAIHEDPQGNLWFGSWGGGISKYNGNSFISYTTSEGLSNNYIRSMYSDNSGNLWITTELGGANKFQNIPFVHFTEKQGLNQNIVWAVYEDSRNNLWLGTWGGGVTKFNESTFTHYTTEEGLSNNYVKTIFEDSKGNLWFGTRSGGVNKFDGKTFTHFTKANGLAHNYVASIMEDSKGNMWFGTYGGGVSKYDGNTFTNYSTEAGLSDNRVFAMQEDSAGNIWFGTYGGGLCRFNGKTFLTFTKKQGLKDNRITSLYRDSQGTLWMGTYGGGVCRYRNGKLITFTEKDGLSNNVVYSITNDNSGNLWFSTEKGLNLLKNPECTKSAFSRKIYTFTKENGLKGTNFFANSVLLDSRNNLWWGSGKSLVRLDMDNFKLRHKPPEIQLRRIDIRQLYVDYRELAGNSTSANQKLNSITDTTKTKREQATFLKNLHYKKVADFANYPEKLVLPHSISHLSFYFSAIDWKAPHKIRYRYKLEGLEKSWSRLTANPKADYRNLSHGKYTFKVKAKGIAGKWSEPLSYNFVIQPPWWLTWWAWMFFAVVFALLLLGIFKWRTAALRKRQKELEALIKKRTQEIQMQNTKLNNQKEEIQTQAENLKQANQELNAKNKILEDLNHEKNSMMDIVAHDLKTPLNNVYGLLQLIEAENELTESQQEHIMTCYNVIKEGSNLIRDLMDINAIEEFQTKVDYSEVNLSEFMEHIIQLHRNTASQKAIHIHYHSKIKNPVFNTDTNFLRRILDNLISNALKFSPFNSNIYVYLSDDDNTVKITIEDEGPGFTEKDQERAFKKFQKLSARPTNNEGSTGLGLSIVKTLVERLNGTISLNSEAGKGSRFTVTFPRRKQKKGKE